MEFRTGVSVEESIKKISHSSGVMLVGSCFASEMAGKMKEGLIPVLANPAGVVYNPGSVALTLRNLIAAKVYSEKDLWFHSNKWLSFAHYTDFSSDEKEKCLAGINNTGPVREFLKKAEFLFVTFGTARIFRRADTGEIVSNCHKIPASFFTRELLTVDSIVEDWTLLLNELQEYNQDLKVVFTVSPVRHWKDGAHGNQISKSVLFLAIEELQKHKVQPAYFPSYEILMDDLRDYRFYNSDMLHPSAAAIDYIWEKFCEAYFSEPTFKLWNEISALTRASRHRFMGATKLEKQEFVMNMLRKISSIESATKNPDLSALKEYFTNLSGNR